MTWQWTMVAIAFWTVVGVVIAGFLPKTTLWVHARIVGIPAAVGKVRDALVWLEQNMPGVKKAPPP